MRLSSGCGHFRSFANVGKAASRSRGAETGWGAGSLAVASHLHYTMGIRTSTLPAVRVEPALRSDAEAVLDEGESHSDFVASCVRDGVAWRRTRDAFLTRARDAVERSAREDSEVSPQEALRRMDERLESARKRRAAGRSSAGK
jgi:hypothetical protein